MSLLERTLVASLTLLLGCGGNVNLGGKHSPNDDSNDDSPMTGDPDASGSTSVLKLRDITARNLAVDGDYLYFTGNSANDTLGLYRCNKTGCKETLSLLVKGNFAFPQVFSDRLVVSSFGEGNYEITSFALPSATDPRVVVSDLPALQPTPALFTEKFAYFGLVMDGNAYRCAQPDCPAGPELIAPIRNRDFVAFHAEADQLFWSDNSFINRVGAYGSAPVQTLLPDELLSEASAEALSPDSPPLDGVESITVADGMLYASVARSQDGRPCDSYCPHQIVGWPVSGGAIQVFFSSDTLLRNVAVVDGELMWLGPSAKLADERAARVSTCRIEACEATHRALGEVRAESAIFTADDHDLYWVESKERKPGHFYDGFTVDEIRRAPRLMKP
jgi:hypothetical protein